MNNRLNLYNSTIYTYLESKDKNKFRRIAFKHKMSVSQFNRYLILLVIKLDEMKKLNNQKDLTDADIVTLLSQIGRNVL